MKTCQMKWVCLVFMLCISCVVWSQLTVFTEDFEAATFSSGWTQSPTTLTPWSVGTGVIGIQQAYEGQQYASLYTSSTQAPVRLITPLIDLSALTDPEMVFAVIQPMAAGNVHDTLKIYTRANVTDAWQEVLVLSDAVNSWNLKRINLSGFASANPNIQIAFEYNYGAGKGIGIDNVIFGNESRCFTPDNLAAYRVTHESALLSWNSSEYSLGYHLKVSTTPLESLNEKANVLDSIIYEKPYNLSGLTNNTTYYFYLQAICEDNDTSAWSESSSFTTLCQPFNLPYFETFDNNVAGSQPNCWVASTLFSGDWDSFTSSYDTYNVACNSVQSHSGNNSLKLLGYYLNASTYSSPRITKQYAVMPKVDASNLSTYQVSFWMRTGSLKNKMFVGLMADPNDIATFEQVAIIKADELDTWEEFIIPFDSLDNPINKYVAFYIDGSTSSASQTIYIDDVAIEAIPTCSKPTRIKTTLISSDFVDLSWNNTQASTFRVVFASQPINPDTATVGVIKDTLVTTNNIHIDQLQASTPYYFYVQGICSNTDKSPWSNQEKILTLCPAISQFPFVQDFESVALGGYPGCWSKKQNFCNYPDYPIVVSKSAYVNGNGLSFSSDASSFNLAVMPEITVAPLSEFKMELTYSGSKSGDILEVGVIQNPTDTSTFVSMRKFIVNSPSVKYNGVVYFTASSGNENFIAFRSKRNTTNTVYLDDIKLSHIGPCGPPSNVVVSNITDTSAQINWDANSNNVSYKIKVSTEELVNPSNTVANGFDSIVNSNQILVSNLSGSQHYYIYSATICDSITSEWEVTEFTTACGIITAIPYTEDFSNYYTGEFNGCWTTLYGTTPKIVAPSTSETTYNDSPTLKFIGSETMIATPVIAADINTLRITFNIAQEKKASGDMIVGVLSDLNDSSTFEPIKTITMTTYETFKEVTVDFDNATLQGGNRYIAFKQNTTTASASFWLDDLEISKIPMCKESVSNIKLNALSNERAQLSWKKIDNVLGYEVSCMPSRNTLNPDSLIFCSTDSVTLVNLTESTTYYLYIRAICSNVDTGAWTTQAFTVVTTPIPAPLPYDFGFEDTNENNKWLLSNGNATNKWYINNAVAKNGTKSLYISDDSGASYSYTSKKSANASYVYASRTFDIPAGQVDISFDWKANGRSTSDYLVAFLVPAKISLYEGSKYTSSLVYPFSSYRYSATSVKSGWIMLGNDKLNGKTTWQHFQDIVSLEDSGCYNLVFYWANYYSSTSTVVAPPAAIDNIKLTAVRCGVPVLESVSVSDSSATLQWRGLNNPSNYELKLSTTEWVDASTEPSWVYNMVVSTDSVDIYGLEANTLYYAYLRSYCNTSDTSDWNSFTLRTECKPLVNTYIEDFEGYGTGTKIQHPCWSQVQSSGSYPYLVSGYNHSANGNASYAFVTSAALSSKTILASPRISENINTREAIFYTYSLQSLQTVEIGVMSDLSDPNTFEVVDTITTADAKLWEKQVVDFSSYTGNGHYIAFRTGGKLQSNGIYIDDVTIEEHKSCSKPENITVRKVTTNSARLQWSSSTFLNNIKISEVPIDPETQASDFFDVQNLQDNSLDLTDLTPSTIYYVYVQAVCGDSTGSLWSNPFTFTTSCLPMDLPYSEHFNNQPAGSEANCWSSIVETVGQISVGANYPYVPTIVDNISDGSDSQSYQLYANYESSTVNSVLRTNSSKSFAILPQFIADLSALQITFNHYSSTANAPLYIGAVSDPTDGASFEIIDTLLLSSWAETTINLSDYQGTNQFFAFMVDASGTQSPYTIYIDGIEVDSVRNCQAPINLRTSYIDNQSAIINWEALSAADTIFNVQISTYDAGKNVEDMDLPQYASTILVDTAVIGNQIHVQGLSSGTTYYYYIRSICQDNTFSERYSNSLSFTTACEPQKMPFFEDFEDVQFPYDCWITERSVQSGTSISNWQRNTATKYAGNGAIKLPQLAAGNKSNLVLPFVEIDTSNVYVLKFMMYRSSSYSSKINEGVKVWINQTPDTIGGVPLMYITRYYKAEPIVTKAGWYEYMDTLKVQGNYYIIFEDISDEGDAIYLDNISIAHKDACAIMDDPTVSNLTASSISFNWVSDTTQMIQVACELTDVPEQYVHPITLKKGQTTYEATNLLPNTAYKLYVRNACEYGVPNSWASVEARTLQVAAQIPFNESFESDSLNNCWTLVGNNVNHFMVGQSTASQGQNSLYITEDDTNNTYNIASASYAFAYRTVYLNPGAYDLNFKWKSGAESSTDFGRVFIAPSTFIPIPGSANGITNATTTPSGWLLGEQILSNTLDWANQSSVFNITTPGEYQLLFYWYNNASKGTQPPLAIDSISLTERSCFEPFDLKATCIMSKQVTISAISDAPRFQIKVDTLLHDLAVIDTVPTLIDTMTTTNASIIYGLQPESNYYYWLRSFCDNDTSAWLTGEEFTTRCAALLIDETHMYVDDFESYGAGFGKHPDCWTYHSEYTPASYPYIRAEYGSNGSNGFLMYVSAAKTYTYIVTPELDADMSRVLVTYSSYSASSNQILRVGVMTDPSDYSTFVELDSVMAASIWQEKNLSLKDYNVTGKYIAFAVDRDRSGVVGNYIIDDLKISYMEECAMPFGLEADSIGANAVKLQWTSNNANNQWHILVLPNNAATANSAIALIDTIVTGNPTIISSLNASTSYKVAIAAICNDGDTSQLSTLYGFTTNCEVSSLPFNEYFNLALPNCWNSYRGIPADIFKGTSHLVSYDNSWTLESNKGLSGNHLKLNVVGTSTNTWLVSPMIEVLNQSVLAFDLALTTHNAKTSVTTGNQSDDKFMVIISTDGGNSWSASHITEWNNMGNGDYSFDSIPSTGQKVIIDLSQYQGQTISIAFYGESTVKNGDNDIHIDNVHVNQILPYSYAATVCDDYDYQNDGFNISRFDIDINKSPMQFTRTGYNNEGSDSLITLTLTVNPNTIQTIDTTICYGSVYNDNGFNASVTNQYRRTLFSTSGCDSIIILNLTVLPQISTTFTTKVCPSDLPYNWQGQSISTTGIYYDNLTAVNGCDSLLILDFTVLPDYDINEVLSISANELPYQYLDTLFTESTALNQVITYVHHGLTADGCDSIVTLNLTVLSVGVNEITDLNFEVYPNPATLNDLVYVATQLSEADLQGLVIDIYNGLGNCVKHLEPSNLPITFSGFDASGVYMVRISTRNNQIIWKKLIVK